METKSSENVEYVVADAKSIDALNSTIARQCSTTLYSQINSVQSQVLIGGSSYSPQTESSSSDPNKAILVRRNETSPTKKDVSALKKSPTVKPSTDNMKSTTDL